MRLHTKRAIPLTIRGGTSVAKGGRLRMGFLDSIGQRAPQSRAQGSRSPVNQTPTPKDASRGVQTAPTWKPAQNDRIHPAAIWCAVLFFVGAVAAAAWLGMRNSAVASPDTENAAEAQTQTASPVDKLNPKTRSVQPQAAVRRGTGVEPIADRGKPRADAANEAAAADDALINQPENVTDTEGGRMAAASDPISAASIGAIPEDDYVYSGEGAGIVAPRLTSLGFVRRLVSGLRVRTSTIELVVSKSGTVERAKIFSTPAHWEDALLLSRAKTFQFVPAYRNGYPVRYRFVMDVDTSP